jgi:hypothetical protein
MNTDLVNKLASEAGWVRITPGSLADQLQDIYNQNLVRAVVHECARLFEDDGSLSSIAEYVHNNRCRDIILEHFGIQP